MIVTSQGEAAVRGERHGKSPVAFDPTASCLGWRSFADWGTRDDWSDEQSDDGPEMGRHIDVPRPRFREKRVRIKFPDVLEHGAGAWLWRMLPGAFQDNSLLRLANTLLCRLFSLLVF